VNPAGLATAVAVVAMASEPATAPAPAPLHAVVRAAGTRDPVASARVLVTPELGDREPGPVPVGEHLDPSGPEPAWIRPATSEADGTFTVDDLPGARVRVIVLAGGYQRLETILDLSGDPPKRPRPLFLTADPANAYRTVVAQPEAEAPGKVTSHRLSREEIATMPGTQGDSLRALQNFPGVARAPGGLGLLVLRGAAPNQSRVFYGEHAIPRAFHALAFASIVPADAMESIDFMPGNAPSRYGETTGGVVLIEPRKLRRDGFHGHGEVDLAGTSALVRGPLGKGAFLVAAQRGWVDGVLRVAERVDDTQTFTLPNYYDYQALLEHPLADGQSVGVRVLGAGDRVRTRVVNPRTGERETPLQLSTQFHRADFVYRKRAGRWSFVLSPTFRFETNAVSLRIDARRVRRDYATGWRMEATRRLSPRAEVTLGTDGEVAPYRLLRTPIESDLDPMTGRVINVRDGETTKRKGLQSTFGAYAQGDVRFGAVTLWPGVRVDAYTLGSDVESSFDPRLSGRWQIDDRWAWRFGVGRYSQAVVAQQVSRTDFLLDVTQSIAGNVVLPASISALEPRAGFEPAAGSLRVARAVQASTGAQFDLDERWGFELGAYGRVRANEDGVAHIGDPQSVTHFLTEDTYGVAYGLEALARMRPTGKLYGWLAYTLSRSEVRFLDARGGPEAPLDSAFDQRHILALLASYALPRHWRVGGRFRVVSGSPYTPIVGRVELPATGETRIVPGRDNSAQFPVFHQLDLRVDKQWILPRTILTLYLDVQNVYNRVNVEAYVYDFEFRERINAVGLPIFPSIGFRIDL
jgi:hypothetical protein